MADIFISYAREDRAQAERLAAALQSEGFKVWRDIESLRSGRSFSDSIQTALKGAERVLVLWSASSVSSRWVDAEALWAWEHDKLHSVWLADEVSVRVPFNASHARNLAAWDGSSESPEFRRLVLDVRALLRAEDGSSAAVATRVSEIRRDLLLAGSPEALKRLHNRARALSGEFPHQPDVLDLVDDVERAIESLSAPRQPRAPKAFGRKIPSWIPAAAVATILVSVGPWLWYQYQSEVPDPAQSTQPIDDPSVEQPATAPGEARGTSKPPPRPLETFQGCPECPEMVVIPAGSFQMGSPEGEGDSDEHPQHEVRIAEPFAIGRTEVTFDQWDACVAAGGCSEKPDDEEWGRGKRPVINVSWEDTRKYVGWLSENIGKPYRLPTEAEWEYAARAGTTTPFSTGKCIDTDQANYNGDYDWEDCPKTGIYRKKTVEVGAFPANPWGLHEVHGNVREWVQDCWNRSYEGAPADGSSAWESGECGLRVVRGGSWNTDPGYLRSAARSRDERDRRDGSVGFRVAQDL